MNNDKKHKNGIVCYIDLLGISYLSLSLNDDRIIESEDSNSVFNKKNGDGSFSELKTIINESLVDQKFSEKISDLNYQIIHNNIQNFHKIIKDITNNYNLNYSIFSDAIFIFSDDVKSLLFAVANVFRDCINKGILLRAGLSYGLYYEVNTALGISIYGPAVTNAVKLERKGKGCRIFTDGKCSEYCVRFFRQVKNIFYPYPDYNIYDMLEVFEWSMIKGDSYYSPKYVDDLKEFFNQKEIKDKCLIDDEYIKKCVFYSKMSSSIQLIWDLFADNINLISKLYFSPDFYWNRETEGGKKQLQATILYLQGVQRKMLNNFNLSNDFQKYDSFITKFSKEELNIIDSFNNREKLKLIYSLIGKN